MKLRSLVFTALNAASGFALASENISFEHSAAGLVVQARAYAQVSSFNYGTVVDAPPTVTFSSKDPFESAIVDQTISSSAFARNPIYPQVSSSASSLASFTVTEADGFSELRGFVTGTVNYTSNNQPGWGFSTVALTQLDFTFEVLAAVEYTFAGTFSVAAFGNGTGGDSIATLLGDESLFRFELKRTNGQSVTQFWESSGLLDPGLYRFSVFAQPYWKGTTTTGFEFLLNDVSPVPEESSSLLLAIGLAVVGLASRRLRREDNT